MGEGVDGVLGGLIDRFAGRVLEFRDQNTVEQKFQIQQWLLSCELDRVSGAFLPISVARVKQEIGGECLQAFSGQVPHESRLQQEVAGVLRRAVSEMEIEEEYRDARSGYSIDVLVRRRPAAGSTGGADSPDETAGEWAVEVDGPTHFLGDGRTPSGSTLLKRKQLGQLGYRVVPVPFWEWRALRGEEAKRWYLEDKIKGGEKQMGLRVRNVSNAARGRGPKHEPEIGRGGDAPGKLSDWKGGYRGGGAGGTVNYTQLSGVIMGCSEAGELVHILHTQRGALDHIHVSAAWGCLANIGTGRNRREVRGVVATLQDLTRDVLDQLGGRGVGGVMHSMAKLHTMGERMDRGLLKAMQRRATATVGEFEPQGVKDVLWALATMGVQTDQGLLEAMQRRATATAEEFNPQEIVDVLWALAKMGDTVDPGLLGAMQRRVTETAGAFTAQEVGNVLWALAKMGERADPGLLEAMQKRATATAGVFEPQGVKDVLWALATMGAQADQGLLEAMQMRATATAG
ncbi:RAP domain-containing protein, partial [Baffinella frigidus]